TASKQFTNSSDFNFNSNSEQKLSVVTKNQHNDKSEQKFDDISTFRVEANRKTELKNERIPTNVIDINSQTKKEVIEKDELTSQNSKPTPVRVSDIPTKVASFVQNAKEVPIKAEILLHPKSLGTVVVEMNVINDKIEIMFKSEQKETLQAIESQVGILKDKLQNLGFEKQTFSFHHQLEERDSGFGAFSNRQNKQQDEALKREFLRSFLKHQIYNGNFTKDRWGENDYQH
ncbi:MAG: flagellar hook-length control protein FliK, partial [Ignavibacteria bacterium]|nr:flagellar hook-length control protein FliK [Ignavibacteria bacterium]